MAAKDAIQKQFVNLSLTGGVNKKKDAHQLQNGELLTADNVVFGVVEGQVTKRYGCASIAPQGASLKGGPFRALGVRDNIEPLILGVNTLNRYNVERNLSTSIPTPTQGRLDVTQVVGSTGQSTFPWPPSDASVATDGSQYACVTWQEPNATGSLCFYGVQDLASGTWIIPPKPLTALPNAGSGAYTFAAISSPTVKYYNGNFYLFYIWSGSTTSGGATTYFAFAQYNMLPITNLASGMVAGPSAFPISGSNSITVSLSPCPVGYDVHISGGKFILASGPSLADSVSFDVNMGVVNADGSLSTANKQILASVVTLTSQRCAVRCNGPAAFPYMVALCNQLTRYSPTFVKTQYQITVDNQRYAQRMPVDCLWMPDGTAVWAGCFYVRPTMEMQVVVLSINDQTASIKQINTKPPLTTLYQNLISRLFVNGTKVYAWVGVAGPSSDSVYNSAFLTEFDIEQTTAMIACRTLYMKNAHVTNIDMMVPCDVVQIAGTSKYVTFITSSLEKTGDGFRAFGALNRVVFDFAPVRATQLISLPQGGVLGAGAYPFYYDGNAVVEAGFSSTPTYDVMSQTQATVYWDNTPQVSTGSTSGLAGGSSLVTTSGYMEYYYVVCLVRRDAYGNVYRSAPSPVASVVCPSAFQTVTFPPYVYNGGGNVMIEYYRSTQNIPNTYYFIGQVANGTSFTDTKNDGSTTPSNNTSITKNRTVYTNANELPNDPPPAVHHAAVSETRVYIIPSDARNTIWFSKLFSPGRTVEFSANNVLSTGNNSGLFNAIAILDTNIVVFKNDEILYFYGNGPDNTGSGSFSSFQRLTTDVGCIDPASIVTIPDGLLFRSRRGIELLNRSLQVTYIGAPVEPLVKTMGSIASAVVVPKLTQVRFVPKTAGSPVLVYDYAGNRWSTFSNMAATQAAPINGEYWWIAADGSKVYQETPNLYLDDGLPIQITLETPEIPVGAAGAQGWGRAYRMALLGDFYNDFTLNIQFAYDHSNVYTDAVNFSTATGLINGDQVFQFRTSRLPRQVMQTMRLKIQDTGTTGQSCAISNIALEVGPKNGLAKLADQKTI